MKVKQKAGDPTRLLTNVYIYLEKGKKNDFIQVIEDGYNSSSCTKFPARFILEGEVLALMKSMGKE